MTAYRSIEWRSGALRMLDQRLIPEQTAYIDYTEYRDVAEAIREMIVRGAPAIGAAAAYGLALAAQQSLQAGAAAALRNGVPGAQADSADRMRADLNEAAAVLKAARPTAVNLFWAVDRVMAAAANPALETAEAIAEAVLAEAHAIAEEDVKTNKAIGLNALPLVPAKANFIHHCNTGALATIDYGTALGIIRTAHEHGRQVHVYVDETRPRLQGARLTAWELQQQGIPHTLIVDGASGHVMRTRGVDLCVVGCDRVAANGDTANKIGTYNLALAARAHGVPFYVAAPTSTIDMSIASGDQIEIEERTPLEVTRIGATDVAPRGCPVYNPAFDVTPAEYITAIITEVGVAYPPFTESLPKLMAQRPRRSE